ncbi:hypothetical protein NUACC21_56180 [Scytonema sp. NUACC21]
MTDTKIQGKFYPLQHEEWLKVYKELTDSQRGVLYYLRSLDPYSNGLRIRASKIAGDLGISRQTVYKAIDVLEEKGYVNKEDVDYTLKIQSKGFLCDTYSNVTHLSPESDSCKSQATVVNVERRLSSKSNSCKSQTTVVNVERQLQPETPTQQELQSSKTIQTYSDFIQTLSEEERGSFLDFCREKTKNLSKEVNDIEAWLAHTTKAGQNRWDVYYEKFTLHQQKQTNKSKSSANSQMMKKFTSEIEQRYQQAQANWQKSQAESCETGGTA